MVAEGLGFGKNQSLWVDDRYRANLAYLVSIVTYSPLSWKGVGGGSPPIHVHFHGIPRVEFGVRIPRSSRNSDVL